MMGRPRKTKTCKIKGCANPHRAKGYCTGHYARKRAGLNMAGPIMNRPGGPGARTTGCSVEGCEREHYGRGFCVNHYNQDRRKRMVEPAAEPEI